MHQPFYNREGRLGFPCLIECFNVSRKPFVFTHQVDQMFLCIHERKTIFQRYFYKRFTGKFRQMLSKDALQNPFFAKIDEKSTYINQNNKIIIYPQYRVLLGSKCSKLNELFCNYKETCCLLGNIHTLFYWVVFIYPTVTSARSCNNVDHLF